MEELLDMPLIVENHRRKPYFPTCLPAARWMGIWDIPMDATQRDMSMRQTGIFRSPQMVELDNMTREAYRAQESAKPRF